MKIFNIEGFDVNIDDRLFDAAVACHVLEPGNTEEERYGNSLYIENAIRAGNCKTLDDLKDFSFEKLRKEKNDKEISETVSKMIIRTMNDYGVSYDNS